MQRSEFTKKTKARDASKLKVAIVASRFNADITDPLLGGAQKVLKEWGVPASNVRVIRVYGAFDIPFACKKVIDEWSPDGIIALGCIIKGETDHDRYIASAVSHGIIDLTLSSGVPISFGVITANTLAQAKARSRGKTNHGEKAAVALLEMALL